MSPDKQIGKENKKNESESYRVAAYIGILFFLWDVPCRWVLVGGIFSRDTLFNFSNFDWEVCHGVSSNHNISFGFTIVHTIFEIKTNFEINKYQ